MINAELNIKSYEMAVAVVKLSRFLQSQYENIMSEQLFKNGTAIALLIQETPLQASKSKEAYKLRKAQEKTNKTAYWLRLLKDSKIIKDDVYEPLQKACAELDTMLGDELSAYSTD